MLCFENINRIISPIDEENIMAIVEFKNKCSETKLSAVYISDDVDIKKPIFKYVLSMDVDVTSMFRSVNHKV